MFRNHLTLLPIYLLITHHCLPLQALPSFMKTNVNMPSRSNCNSLRTIPESPVGGSSFIYSHYLPSGIPLDHRITNFRSSHLNPLYNVLRRGYIMSVFAFLQILGTHSIQTPCLILLDPE